MASARARRDKATDARNHAHAVEMLEQLEQLRDKWQTVAANMLRSEHGGQYLLPPELPRPMGLCLTYWSARVQLFRAFSSLPTREPGACPFRDE